MTGKTIESIKILKSREALVIKFTNGTHVVIEKYITNSGYTVQLLLNGKDITKYNLEVINEEPFFMSPIIWHNHKNLFTVKLLRND